MVLTYKELINNGYSDYKIKNLLKDNKIFIISKGMYSTSKQYDILEFLTKKHPNAVVTLESACYCYGLLAKKPEIPVVATKQKDRKIKDVNVKQIFMPYSYYDIGVNTIKYKNYNIKIYDLERLLIEILRYKTKINYDIYIQIVQSYRRIRKLLKQEKIIKYLEFFDNKNIEKRIQNEIFN